MKNSGLIEHNSLTLLDSGIWVKADEADRSFIDYTDGDSTEVAVYEKVSSARDRSVYSDELDQPWQDWALEYHLGSKRSNIYRGLNLDGVKTVLEVGCGCGAITRFLGEQGYQVDAIEGTLRRAQIARLRTQELENVRIISSNYHQLVLPEKFYDLVVFTGVLEYSGAYAPGGVSPEAQLQSTLLQARSAMSEQGQILIAIENRTGFKYLAGAGEDHLNVPSIGLLGYPEPASKKLTRGIRTWSKREWRSMLSVFGFDTFEFCYPFPDYKVPDAIVSDQFLDQMSHPDQVLAGVYSRDYASMWLPNISEALFWKTAAQTSSLDQYANSFLIVVSNSAAQRGQAIDFDFVRFASVRRKLVYRRQVQKKSGEDAVQRVPLPEATKLDQTDADLVRQHPIKGEKYIDGQGLEQIWMQALMVVSSYDELAEHIQTYAAWLADRVEAGITEYVDALPQNIIVDDKGAWHLIDQEWHAVEGFSVEVIIFRALFNFALNARDALADMELNAAHRAVGIMPEQITFPLIQNLDDFVRWGFELLGLDYVQQRKSCIDFETRLHQQVSRAVFETDLEAMLLTPIYQWHHGQSFDIPSKPLKALAFWSQLDEVWHLDHSVSRQITFEHGLNVSLELPPALQTHRFLRIDPAADVLQIYRGWLEFRYLSIRVKRTTGESQRVFHLQGTAELQDRARVKGMRLLGGERIMLTSASASMVLDLNDVAWGEDLESIELTLVMDLSSDKNQITARQILREESVRAACRIRLRQHIFDKQQQRLNDNEAHLADLQNQIHQNSTTVAGRLLACLGLMRKPV